MEKKKSNRSRLISLIHAQKSAAKLTDDEYRLVLSGATGKQSCTDCNMQELFKVFANLNIVLKQKGQERFYFKWEYHQSTMQDSIIARAKRILGDGWEKRLNGFLQNRNKETLAQCSDNELRQIQGWLSNVERGNK